MTSSTNSPLRLSKLEKDDLELHSFLTGSDECYYLYEYTSRKGYSFSPTNQLIANLKKDPAKYRFTHAWPHKVRAIRECAAALAQTINGKAFLADAVFVPVPPSKIKGDPHYDDRMQKVVAAAFPDGNRELVRQTASAQAAHEAAEGERMSIEELMALYEIDESIAKPEPKIIAIVDDVLTTGRHFVAMKRVLAARFPKARITGFFIARRVFPTEDVLDFSDVITDED